MIPAVATRPNERNRMEGDVNVLALVKGSERYILLFTDQYRGSAISHLGRMASDPELSFTWYDAAVLSQRLRRQEEACRGK